MKVVLFNGPPRSGKDSALIGLRCYLALNVTHYKLAEPLKHATHALYGLFADEDCKPSYEDRKDVPHSDFFGLAPRQAYIQVSERMVKPVLGADFFGRLLAKRLREEKPELAVVTDCGFAAEVAPIIDAVGESNILLVRLHRPGSTFDGDSRGYLNLPNAVAAIDLHNNRDLRSFELEVTTTVFCWAAVQRD